MNRSQKGGPPASMSRARMLSAWVAGSQRLPQAPIWANTGTRAIAFSVRL
jgi:hypothetical protein